MKRIFTIIAIIALIGSVHAQTPGEHFDANHYEIRLWDFNFSSHTIQGEAFIDVTVTAPTDTFVLELKSLTVTDAATESYSVTSFTQEGDFLTIVIDEPASAGETLTLDIRYGGNTFSESWGGVEWWGADYVYNLGVGFDSQPHNLGKTWFPCVDNFTDKASYSLYITVTNDKKAICGGNLVNVFDNGDGTSTWHWETPQEIATYHISFAIGNYELWEDVYHGIERDIPIQVYAKPNQMGNVPGTFTHVKEIAAFYEENFGPYPFNRIGYVSTGKGCMEHTDNIAMASTIIDGTTTQEEYVAHELSHMYFGNKVTCSTAGDMWLNEGFAQFCGVFYLAGVYGEAEYNDEMSSKINTIVNWCNSEINWIPLNNMPLDLTYDTKAIYDRGAVIVNSMMHYMGRDKFIQGIRHYLDTYTYGAASSEQLCEALTEATGIDMQGFFDNYVYIGGMPHYEVNLLNVTPTGTQYEANIRMSYWHVGPSHVGQNNRVEVTFVGAEGQLQTELIGWDGMEADQVVTLDFAPVAVFADYDNHFLDAKLDKNVTATEPMVLSHGNNLKITVNSVTSATMLRAENHLIAPDDDPEIPGLTLSTRHYWNILRLDLNEADVTGSFTYSNNNSMDGDIIQTQNDSAVLLYRASILEPWHTIPYTQTGNWKIGKFEVSDLPTGQYTIGVIDKASLALEEHPTSFSLYPNPAKDQVTLQWKEAEDGEIKVFNQQLQHIKTIPYRRTDQITFSTEGLKPGIYFVEHNAVIHKLIIE